MRLLTAVPAAGGFLTEGSSKGDVKTVESLLTSPLTPGLGCSEEEIRTQVIQKLFIKQAQVKVKINHCLFIECVALGW